MVGDLLILGAGGSSREIAGTVHDINRIEHRWNLLGFLDDDPAKLGAVVDDLPVLGPLSAAQSHEALIVVGIARSRHPGMRRRIVPDLGVPPERYATIVHPSASISPHATI